tara:strand:+ start:137 stop:520 length:384 start_codon:yes stop_codon:yes gene_type:complete
MSKKVLLVEDALEYREKLTKDLEQSGYEVLPAGNGLEGIEILQREGSNISIIVTDLHMPKLNGIDMAKRIIEEKIATAPIMILTTDASVEMRETGLAAGIRHWLLKPVPTQKFLGAIELLIERFGND